MAAMKLTVGPELFPGGPPTVGAAMPATGNVKVTKVAGQSVDIEFTDLSLQPPAAPGPEAAPPGGGSPADTIYPGGPRP